jgi:hypoxanthine phosphoribosyltransferase
MNTVQILDKKFTLSISSEKIEKEVTRVACEISRDMKDKNPIFLSVLNGSFMFASDLMKKVNIPSTMTFVKLASYQGLNSTGIIKEVVGLSEDIKDRVVVIVEDIVDTGITMQHLLETLGTRNPKEIHIATLLVKPEKLQVDLNIEYKALEIPNDFIVGYGLDYDGYGRNLPEIYTLVNE